MHNNYYFLRQLTPRLAELLLDSQLQAAFSQNRDELVLEFALPDPTARSFYLKAYLDPKFCCLQLPQRFHRAKKNSVDLFPEVQRAQSFKSGSLRTNEALRFTCNLPTAPPISCYSRCTATEPT